MPGCGSEEPNGSGIYVHSSFVAGRNSDESLCRKRLANASLTLLAGAWLGEDEESMTSERSDIEAAIHHLHQAHTDEKVGQRLNWLRAGVLGGNDGIVSVAGVGVGVAAATPGNVVSIMTAGVATLVAGAFSMTGGGYVSVSTQRDTEKALIAKEVQELNEQPAAELDELTRGCIYGLVPCRGR